MHRPSTPTGLFTASTLEALLLFLLTGCGDAAPPDPNPRPDADYYPMRDGLVSVYRHSNKGGWDETVTLTALGDDRFSEVDSPSPDGERTESVQEVDAAGRVWRIEKHDYVDDELDISVEYEPGFIRFDPAWLALQPNESVRMAYERTETAAGDTPDPARERAHIYTSQGYESVTVLDRTYHDCLVIQRQRDYEDTQGNAEDEEKQFYFAPDVGKVLEVNLDSGHTEELVSNDD
ncbi:MAG TPA: hypothetical protein VFU02_23725 [Polyangiaceae bacterium]|nr:hypothetical protein [Polyangiaceae bacterium]